MKKILNFLKKIFSSKPNYSIKMKQLLYALPKSHEIDNISDVYFICDVLNTNLETIEDYLLEGRSEELKNEYRATTQTNNISIYLIKMKNKQCFYYFIEDNLELYDRDKLIKILQLSKEEINSDNYELIYSATKCEV